MENAPLVKRIHDALRARGHEISHDWTSDDARARTPSDRRRCAAEDKHGVQDAQGLVVLVHPEMRNTLVEVGIAVGMEKPIFLLDAEDYEVDYNTDIFFLLPQCRQALSLPMLLDMIDDYAGARGLVAR